MRLSQFITKEIDLLAQDFEDFAQNNLENTAGLDPKELRNHISSLLSYIAADMVESQSAKEQEDKARSKPRKAVKDSIAQIHGAQRGDVGLTIIDLAREHRALRANILKHWMAQLAVPDTQDLYDMVRFNESIDEVQIEAQDRFNSQVEEAKRYFLSVLGHDLRSPLGAIEGSAALLSRSENLDDLEEGVVEQIIISSEKITAIIDNLLELVRFKLAGGLTIERAPANMGDICAKVVSECRLSYPKANIILDVEGDLNGEWDQMRMAQVLANLILNALEHGEMTTPVTIIARGTEEDAIIKVHNYGRVISPEEQKDIFQRFKKQKAGSTPRNLGLGLYIVHEIVEAHGGTVNVTSNTEDGTTFTLHLPRSQ